MLWKAYEGIVGVEDAFSKVNHASRTVDTIRNKLSVLRDAEESLQTTSVKDEDINCKLEPETEDIKASDALK